ncbi:phenylalanine--tRNA ligase subunit beta [Candidatus Saccharibacteria bacterium]|nr:phenylalanine--tRNA ligase subunit beta [Candidatus Saccharibacteria bacterium]
MKVSLNWVEWINEKYGCAANPAPKGVDDLVDRIGRQLGAVEEVIDLGQKYQGIVVAKVIKSEKHPNADNLSVCLIDDGGAVKKVKRGSDGLVQVVHGAKNVKAGQLVVWIPPGVTVPSTYDEEPFVLAAKALRGVVSNGMIASAKELAIADEHEGILVIDQPAKPGQRFASVYHLDDYIIDIENKMFTHRPDLFGMLGIAREIAGIQRQVFKSPDWYRENASLPGPRGNGLKLAVKNQLPKIVPRFSAVVIRDVAVGPSPVWLQSKLSRVGIRPVNNIVDLTNFYMYETAQPLHAYDFDKVCDLVEQKAINNKQKTGATIIIRKPKPGETLKLLGGKTIKLQPGDIVIASADKAIGLGGVMGGAETEVGSNTRNIILECANFEMTAVRKSAMNHGLFTDAVTRFTKGQSLRQNLTVLAKLVDDILKPGLSGGRIASPLIDLVDRSAISNKQKTINVSAEFVNQRLGLGLSASEIKKLLGNVEFKVNASGQKLNVEVPFWRTDIEITEDIVEEVGRLYGYDRLELQLPTKSLKPADRNSAMDLKTQLRQILSKAGANEVQAYSFVDAQLLRQVGQDPKNSHHIRNAISPQLQYYRQSLAPGLLEKIHPNIKAGYEQFALFEIGVSYYKGVLDNEKLPLELPQLGLVLASKTDRAGSPFFGVRALSDYLLSKLGYCQIEYRIPERASLHPALSYYEPAKSANIFADGQMVGRIGEFKDATSQQLKLPDYCAGFELYLPALQMPTASFYSPLNRFPALQQDLTLKAPANLDYRKLTVFIENFLGTEAAKHGYSWQLVPIDIFQKPSDKQHKQTTWRLSLEHTERTLTTTEVNKLLDSLAGAAKKQLKADRI